MHWCAEVQSWAQVIACLWPQWLVTLPDRALKIWNSGFKTLHPLHLGGDVLQPSASPLLPLQKLLHRLAWIIEFPLCANLAVRVFLPFHSELDGGGSIYGSQTDKCDCCVFPFALSWSSQRRICLNGLFGGIIFNTTILLHKIRWIIKEKKGQKHRIYWKKTFKTVKFSFS